MSGMTYDQLLWRSRRGMLELDLLLERYLKQHFESLSAADIAQLVCLLEKQDPVLFSWLMGREEPEPAFKALVENIRYAAQG